MKSILLIYLAVCSAILADDRPPDLTITKETVFSFYRHFDRLTKEPHQVAPLTSELCRAPNPELIEKEKRATGPHYGNLIHIYLNPSAHEAATRRADTFPAGAIVVKEKLGEDNSVTGVGGMIKRPAGYDPKNGDWEYFYADRDGSFSTGRLANCADCHNNARATDRVFSIRDLTRKPSAILRAPAEPVDTPRLDSALPTPSLSIRPPHIVDIASLQLEFPCPLIDDSSDFYFYEMPTIAVRYSRYALRIGGNPRNVPRLATNLTPQR